jgi:hypothetical protein
MQSKLYRQELDVLRFVAFAFVFFFHTAASIRGEMAINGIVEALLSNLLIAVAYGFGYLLPAICLFGYNTVTTGNGSYRHS